MRLSSAPALPLALKFGHSDRDTPLPLIAQSLTYVADDHSKLPTLRAYLSQPYNPPVLIFTSSQPRASSLAEELVLNGIPNVDCLHAGMTLKERDDAVSRMRRGESWVMISTEVMARGMDFKGVREVINYDFPRSVQSYVHRIGKLAFSIILCSQIHVTLSRSYWSSRSGREGSDIFHRRRRPISEVVSGNLSDSCDHMLRGSTLD